MAVAGSIAFTYTSPRDSAPVQLVIFDWTSSAGGAVSEVFSDFLYGIVNRAVFVPDGGGTQPTNLYDVLLKDDHGFDVLEGLAANRSNVNTEEVTPTSLRRVIASRLELAITNAGAAKGGLVYLYLAK